MSARRKLISNALKERFRELCDKRIQNLGEMAFGSEVMPFAERVRKLLSNVSPGQLVESMGGMKMPRFWQEAESNHANNFLATLFAIALAEPLSLRPAEHPPVEPFIQLLAASRTDPEQRIQLLMERYSCPLNFALPEEEEVREFILTRLMANDRARIEKDSIEAVNSDDLMVKLSLVAIYAAHVPDLRFLDALNYYDELLPVGWQPRGKQGVLLAAYFALYARALATWIQEDN